MHFVYKIRHTSGLCYLINILSEKSRKCIQTLYYVGKRCVVKEEYKDVAGKPFLAFPSSRLRIKFVIANLQDTKVTQTPNV